MEKLSMCRICLADNIRMYYIRNTSIQEIYEKLTEKPMETEDKRPLHVCYMCFARLQKCQQLRVNCLQSEELFNKMFDDNLQFVPKATHDFGRLQVSLPVTHLKIETPENTRAGAGLDEGDVIRKKALVTYKEQDKGKHIEGVKKPVQRDGMKKIYQKRGVSIYSVISGLHATPGTDSSADDLIGKKNLGGAVAQKVQPATMEGGSNNSNKNVTEETREENRKAARKLQKEKMRRRRVFVNCCKIAIKPYKCYVCGKCFSKQSNLNIHIRVHTGDIPYKCNACENSYGNKCVSNTDSHAVVKSFKCEMCDQFFNDKTDLTRHVDTTHTIQKPFKCHICKECFGIKCALDNHVLVHAGEKPYRCDVCGKCFAQSDELNTHIRMHTAETAYQCEICQKCFNQKNHLFTHIRTHSAEKPYQCNTCGKCFTNKGGLAIHERIHNDKKIHKCDICDKIFKRSNELAKHVRMHASEKSHKCDVCDKVFSSQRYLKTHSRFHAT